MLTNLKLGSTTGSTALTPSDTNISNNFILPQVQASGGISYDAPTVSGLVPGETGSGATNYGYLYNWPAATAGATRTTNPAGSGDAASSICAKGWRLPVSGDFNSDIGDFADLDRAFGGTGRYASNGPPLSSWKAIGPFGGGFAGSWGGAALTTKAVVASGGHVRQAYLVRPMPSPRVSVLVVSTRETIAIATTGLVFVVS